MEIFIQLRNLLSAQKAGHDILDDFYLKILKKLKKKGSLTGKSYEKIMLKVFCPGKESLADLFGFEKNKEYEEGIHYSPKRVDISNINRISIECDIVEGSYELNKKTNLLENMRFTTSHLIHLTEVTRYYKYRKIL